ncbi:ion transporter [Geodermatophilus normandii]|uniref:Ion transporter n=1 Tax=Geodermatophilus normandii TaxID=1137989 RepID=A0A6P0GH42_9ACTN|nr:ion transporter [Geodermatophilus normandii]
MHTLLFTGPGGAGTTTLASAAAVRAARAGRRVVLLTRQEVPEGTADDVEVVRVEPQASFEALWAARAAELAATLPDLGLPPATSVVPLPGAGELAVLAALGRVGPAADLVVVDGGPLGTGAGLVALPGALRWWLDQAFPARVRVLAAVRTAAVRAGTARRGAVDLALAAVPELEALLDRLTLTDPAETAVWLVGRPRPSAVAALRTATTALAVHGQRPVGVLARRSPGGGPEDWAAARAAEQEAALAALADVAPVQEVAEAAVEPAGADALAALLPDLPEPAGQPAVLAPERVEGGWRLTLPLPFADREGVQLTRWEDDLVVTAAGGRRSVRLDALLRRCVVTSGGLADQGTAAARLEVGFAADPQQWPADLLAATAQDPARMTEPQDPAQMTEPRDPAQMTEPRDTGSQDRGTE